MRGGGDPEGCLKTFPSFLSGFFGSSGLLRYSSCSSAPLSPQHLSVSKEGTLKEGTRGHPGLLSGGNQDLLGDETPTATKLQPTLAASGRQTEAAGGSRVRRLAGTGPGRGRGHLTEKGCLSPFSISPTAPFVVSYPRGGEGSRPGTGGAASARGQHFSRTPGRRHQRALEKHCLW